MSAFAPFAPARPRLDRLTICHRNCRGHFVDAMSEPLPSRSP